MEIFCLKMCKNVTLTSELRPFRVAMNVFLGICQWRSISIADIKYAGFVIYILEFLHIDYLRLSKGGWIGSWDPNIGESYSMINF